MKKIKVSLLIIAKNEEKKIVDCIKSVSWADEVIVVDTGSIDKTVSLARSLDAKVYKYKKGGYSDWRNYAKTKAKNDWIFYLDADERADLLLGSEIDSVIKDQKNYSFYAVPRKNIILGKELKHGGWWPDYVKRLFYKKDLAEWEGELHEEPKVKGDIGYIKHPITHIKHDNLSEMLEKTNKWSLIEARLMFKAKHPPMNTTRFISAMIREAYLRMIRQSAYRDGIEGIIYAIYQVFSKFISYAKLWELQKEK